MLSRNIILKDEIFIIITSDSGIRLVYTLAQLVINSIQVVLAIAIRQEKLKAVRLEKMQQNCVVIQKVLPTRNMQCLLLFFSFNLI